MLGRAETAFREAFERLKLNNPNLLPRGTLVTQNNVAREAGVDPSALKKARFPLLVAEIQCWVESNAQIPHPSPRQALIAQRNRNRDLRERLEGMKIQRDHALGLLAEADALILELTRENSRLQALAPPTNITPIQRKKHKT
ncbi:hypothetical protein [Pseudomonas chlororaphis]|uniref:hypothetical protein n=1 Tax=Pseudomonas chlororaphis TaxID=587753 RepID=UPI001B312205|nr:hypothetical protein [Pseudomonas chlororaphis]MBP5053736.1 hypothetical protein [Pseudomonas chlororaphis]MBP5142376.1 hypothetical protein [Pseudomonas chlororaphis]QTU00913.1 hypothetical protein HUT26_17000 [Pseudomonas chlororaphis]